jgi:hypothetical protein
MVVYKYFFKYQRWQLDFLQFMKQINYNEIYLFWVYQAPAGIEAKSRVLEAWQQIGWQ